MYDSLKKSTLQYITKSINHMENVKKLHKTGLYHLFSEALLYDVDLIPYPQVLRLRVEFGVGGTRNKKSEFWIRGTRTKNALSSYFKDGRIVRNYFLYF